MVSIVVFTSLTIVLMVGNFTVSRIAVAAVAKKETTMTCDSSLQEWILWRDQWIDTLLTQFRTHTQHEGRRYLDIRAMTALSRQIQATFKRCEEALQQHPTFLVNLRKFTGNLARVQAPNHKFGYSISDQDYVKVAQPYVDLPELLSTQKFLQAVSRPQTYHVALDMILEHNKQLSDEMQWQPLIYDSQFLTTPDDTTYGRFFVHVPDMIDGEAVDKWIQFGINTPSAQQTVFCPQENAPKDVTICSLSVVAVRQLKDSTKTQVYLMDYRRRYNSDGSIDVRNNIEANGLTVSCAYCHKSPVLPIHPAAEYYFEGSKLVENTNSATKGVVPRQLNQLILSYGPPNFGDFFDPLDYGPGIGPDKVRRPEFLSACAGTTTFGEQDLNELMSCKRCHNGSLLGLINFPQATHTSIDIDYLQLPDHSVHGLVERYVMTDLMPQPVPHPALTEPQKSALVDCLMKEYFDPVYTTGLLPDWLRDE